MTTLPQTISSRPRPVQSVSGVPTVASPMMAPVAFQPQAPGGLSSADIWRVVRQNLWLFVLTLIVAAGAGYGLNEYLKRDFTTFTAEGKVLVQRPAVYDPTGNYRIAEAEEIDLKTMLQNQVQQLTNDQLLTALLTDGSTATRQSPWLIDEATVNGQFDHGVALEVLKDSFRARPVEGSSIINVSMSAGAPDEAKKILEEIVWRRIDQVRTYNTQDSGSRADFLEGLARDKQNEISRLAADLQRLRATLTADESGDGSALQFELMQITRDKREAEDELMAAQAALQNARDSVARGATVPEVEQRLQMDPTLMPFRQQVWGLETQINADMARFGRNNEYIRSLQTRLDVMRDQLRQREDDQRARATDETIGAMQSMTALAQQRVETLSRQMADLNSAQGAVSQQLAEIKAKQDELQAARAAHADLNNQVNVLKATTNKRPQEDLVWAVQPVTPTEPSFPKLPLTIGVCVVVGLALAVGLAFLREVLDTSVRSPRDIARVGQMNVLGIIPHDSQDPQAGDPLELSIANAPHSMTAEQFRLVRSRLAHAAPLETTRTILVTSPQPGDGKTTVACNLAAGMALNGRRMLLIDANFRRPAIHKVFGISGDRGLADCLADVSQFEELAHETKVPNLFVMPAGAKPENPTELIEGTAFTDVVDRALEEFDHVIFDSGPILYASETGALAPQCDGVISVVRARRSTRGLLARLRDALKSLNVEHLGVVLNGMKHHAGGYYSRNIKTYYAYQGNGRRR